MIFIWTRFAIIHSLYSKNDHDPLYNNKKVYECNFDESECNGSMTINGPYYTLKLDRSFYALKPDLYRISDVSSISIDNFFIFKFPTLFSCFNFRI